MEKIISHFKKVDPLIYEQLSKIISLQGEDGIPIAAKPDDLFETLCSSIVSQQLSNKAAATIFGRLKKLFPKEKITAEGLVKMTSEKLRSVGISNQKANYLIDLSAKVLSKEVELEKFAELPDEKIIEELTLVKGIGRWTAEMFLMFALGREDVFSYGDLILRKSFQKLYGFKKEPTVEEVEKITIKWSPYRTYASRVLWRSYRLDS
ncbi:MAG: DNA-3-methyladenine glycosylase [Candidatus Levyibacteriota bacterium]